MLVARTHVRYPARPVRLPATHEFNRKILEHTALQLRARTKASLIEISRKLDEVKLEHLSRGFNAVGSFSPGIGFEGAGSGNVQPTAKHAITGIGLGPAGPWVRWRFRCPIPARQMMGSTLRQAESMQGQQIRPGVESIGSITPKCKQPGRAQGLEISGDHPVVHRPLRGPVVNKCFVPNTPRAAGIPMNVPYLPAPSRHHRCVFGGISRSCG